MENDFGWLDPKGNFYPVEFEEHEQWARNKLTELGIDADMNRAGDALVKMGWVLIHNPCCDGSIPYTEGCWKPRTKAQREFLYDYYMNKGRPDLATSYLEDAWFEIDH